MSTSSITTCYFNCCTSSWEQAARGHLGGHHRFRRPEFLGTKFIIILGSYLSAMSCFWVLGEEVARQLQPIGMSTHVKVRQGQNCKQFMVPLKGHPVLFTWNTVGSAVGSNAQFVLSLPENLFSYCLIHNTYSSSLSLPTTTIPVLLQVIKFAEEALVLDLVSSPGRWVRGRRIFLCNPGVICYSPGLWSCCTLGNAA